MYHFAANGAAGIIVADNLSKDNTREKMEEAKANIAKYNPDIRVIIVEDNVVAYTQSDKMTNLASMAKDNGAQWVIPFDIDEIWHAHGKTLQEAFELLDQDGVDVYKALYTNHSITEFDQPGTSPFHSMQWKWNLPTNHKSCFKFRDGDSFVRISNGNHLVQHNGWDIGANVKTVLDDYGHDKIIFGPQLLEIRHFQWRSLDHFIKKILNAYESCKALGPGADLYNGAAWAEHFIIYESEGLDGLVKFFQKNVLVTGDTGSMINDPAPIKELPL
jgi:hypothetical protein